MKEGEPRPSIKRGDHDSTESLKEVEAKIISLPKSPQRQQIDNLISAEAIYGKDANPLFDQVGILSGIRTVEKRDYQTDNRQRESDYRCTRYVFGNEPWWVSEKSLGLDFWDDTISFLQQKGYQVVTDEPQSGDVIMYRYEKRNQKIDPTVLHVGIYQGGDKVVSKFNGGHIFEHDISMVPNMFGEEALFMRKLIEKESSR